jgi:hypothetical protein
LNEERRFTVDIKIDKILFLTSNKLDLLPEFHRGAEHQHSVLLRCPQVKMMMINRLMSTGDERKLLKHSWIWNFVRINEMQIKDWKLKLNKLYHFIAAAAETFNSILHLISPHLELFYLRKSFSKKSDESHFTRKTMKIDNL